MQHKEVKKIYNKIVKDKYIGQYEHNRWFKTPMLKIGYDMTKDSIERYFVDTNLKFANYLELGPGAGTWTKLFVEKYSGSKFDLVDISNEMLDLSRQALDSFDNVSYFESDFLQFKTDKKYDLFFSSRAIEYILDKEAFIKKVTNLLVDGAEVCIITKTPHYIRSKIIGRELGEFHQGQITPRQLKKIVKKNGFSNIRLYPVTVHFPIISSVVLDRVLYTIFSKFRLNFISQFFTESYCIIFKKN